MLSLFGYLLLYTAQTRTVSSLLAFPRGASFGYLAAVAMPLDLSQRNVYISFNFESNFGLPPNDSYYQWIERWNLNTSFLGIGNDVTAINGRQQHQAVNNFKYQQQQQQQEHRHISYTRHSFYRTVVGFLQHYGLNGTACLLRSICEVAAARLDEGNGLLGSIFNVIFIPFASAPEPSHVSDYPGTYEAALWGEQTPRDCKRYQRWCPHGVLDMISAFY